MPFVDSYMLVWVGWQPIFLSLKIKENPNCLYCDSYGNQFSGSSSGPHHVSTNIIPAADYLLATSGLKADHGLEGIVDPPLKTGEGTDHDDTSAKTAPDTDRAHILQDLEDAATSALVQLGHNGVSGVGHDGAEDTSEVT